MQHPPSYSKSNLIADALPNSHEHLCENTPLHVHVEQALKTYLRTSGKQPINGLYDTLLAAVEPTLFRVALEFSNTQEQAAKLLGLSRVTLRKKLRQYRSKKPL